MRKSFFLLAALYLLSFPAWPQARVVELAAVAPDTAVSFLALDFTDEQARQWLATFPADSLNGLAECVGLEGKELIEVFHPQGFLCFTPTAMVWGARVRDSTRLAAGMESLHRKKELVSVVGSRFGYSSQVQAELGVAGFAVFGRKEDLDRLSAPKHLAQDARFQGALAARPPEGPLWGWLLSGDMMLPPWMREMLTQFPDNKAALAADFRRMDRFPVLVLRSRGDGVEASSLSSWLMPGPALVTRWVPAEAAERSWVTGRVVPDVGAFGAWAYRMVETMEGMAVRLPMSWRLGISAAKTLRQMTPAANLPANGNWVAFSYHGLPFTVASGGNGTAAVPPQAVLGQHPFSTKDVQGTVFVGSDASWAVLEKPEHTVVTASGGGRVETLRQLLQSYPYPPATFSAAAGRESRKPLFAGFFEDFDLPVRETLLLETTGWTYRLESQQPGELARYLQSLAVQMLPATAAELKPDPLSECESNLKNTGTVMEMYFSDFHHFPKTMAETVPNYFKKLPVCPVSGKTYTSTYKRTKTGYVFRCPGHVHPQLPAGFPRYNSDKGLETGK